MQRSIRSLARTPLWQARPARRPLAAAATPTRAASILCSDSIDPVCVEIFKERGHDVDYKVGLSPDDLAACIHKYDGLVVRSATTVTPQVLDAASNLKVIGRAGVGVDNIDVVEATKKGVLVMNTPGGNTVSTAQLAISLLCSVARSIPQADITMKDGEWARSAFMGVEMSGKTLAIVGCGRIGQEVARWAQTLNMNIIGFDPVMSAQAAQAAGIKLTELDDLWGQADFISLHTPLTPATKGLIGDETLALCKDGVRIVNCARGGIIDEGALLRGLQSGKVGGAALDVYNSEPPEESSFELLQHPGVVCTPHLGASTEEAQINVARDIAVQMCDTLEGSGFEGVMNARHLGLSTVAAMQPFMNLGEVLGKLAAQYTDKPISRLTVETWGGRDISITSDAARELIMAMVQKGVLQYTDSCTVEPNIISAPFLAGQVGLTCVMRSELPSLVGLPYANLVTVSVVTADGSSSTFTGSVFGKEPRIVQIDEQNNFPAVYPEGFLLKFRNEDKPGEMAKILQVLGNHNINVAKLSLGRPEQPGELAIGFVSCDQAVPKSALAELEELGIQQVKCAAFSD